ncbi:hypothetical protein [Pararcticibacter amylolyticus]|nr:hypothetical protein [Pararcticibacter amylolyticus]
MEINYIRLYEKIAKYYPIGFKESDPRYSHFCGIRLLDELNSDKLSPKKYKVWKQVIRDIKNSKKGIIKGDAESPIFQPSYSGSLLLFKKKKDMFLFTREIRVYVSVLAPVYTILGYDNIIIETNLTKPVKFGPVIYISPLDIYEPWFSIIRKNIEACYQDYSFISYSLLSKRIPYLSVPGSHNPDSDSSIFQALFSNEDISSYNFVGDILYE